MCGALAEDAIKGNKNQTDHNTVFPLWTTPRTHEVKRHHNQPAIAEDAMKGCNNQQSISCLPQGWHRMLEVLWSVNGEYINQRMQQLTEHAIPPLEMVDDARTVHNLCKVERCSNQIVASTTKRFLWPWCWELLNSMWHIFTRSAARWIGDSWGHAICPWCRVLPLLLSLVLPSIFFIFLFLFCFTFFFQSYCSETLQYQNTGVSKEKLSRNEV